MNTRTKKITEAASIDPSRLFPVSPEIVSAKGCWMFDRLGNRYFDCTGGSGAINLGHQHPKVVAAATSQMQTLIHTGWNLKSDVRTELINKLGCFSPFDECAVLLTVPGTEGIEASLKVARAYTGRKLVITFERGFHGKSSGALSVTWRDSFKKYAALPENAVMVAPYPILHSPSNEHSPEECIRVLQEIVDQTSEAGHPPAAIILEPIQASEGILPAGRFFMEHVLEIAKAAGCLVIYDEIYTGFCRAGDTFIAAREGLLPDLLVVGKGLGNGLPISAVIGSEKILNALPSGNHSSTFAGNPLACAVGSAVLDVMHECRAWELAGALGEQLKQSLHALGGVYGFVRNIRGEGVLLGFDCVDDDGQPSPENAKAFAKHAQDRGLLLRYGGYNGNTIKVTPPILMSDEEVRFLADTLYTAAGDIAATKGFK